jgi:hypothetical protein
MHVRSWRLLNCAGKDAAGESGSELIYLKRLVGGLHQSCLPPIAALLPRIIDVEDAAKLGRTPTIDDYAIRAQEGVGVA